MRAIGCLWAKRKNHLIVCRRKLMHGPTKSWSGKQTLSHSRSGKPPGRPNRLLVGKKILSNSWSGKLHGKPNRLLVGKGPWQAQQNVGREKCPIANKRSVGKDMSVGKGFPRLDFPQQTRSVGNSFSQPIVCHGKLFFQRT